MMTPEILDSLLTTVEKEAANYFFWSRMWLAICIAVIIILTGLFSFELYDKKSDGKDFSDVSVIIFVCGGLFLMAAGTMGVIVNYYEGIGRRDNTFTYIRGKSEWRTLVVAPAEQAAILSIIEEYESKGLKPDIWQGFLNSQTNSEKK